MAVLTKPRRPKAEANTYGLPRGEALRRELRKVFRGQRQAILHYVRTGDVWSKSWLIEAKTNQPRDARGRWTSSGGGWSGSEVTRRSSRKLDDGIGGGYGKLEKATERLQAIYSRNPIYKTPTLVDRSNGGRLTAQVTKNAHHYGYKGEKKYDAQIFGSRHGVEDSQGFNDLDKAIKYAENRHRSLLRDGLKPEGGAKSLSLKQDAIPFSWPTWGDFGMGLLEMAQRMTPMLTYTWEYASQRFAPRVGLDPNAWSVVDVNTARMIKDAALAFCDSTNATTSLQLEDALAKTREELNAGVVDRGESIEKLTKRINKIFDTAETWRARRIAQTETSRAVHAAQEQTAIASGVVTGWRWLLSSDACPLCHKVAREASAVRLGQPFAVVGDDPNYSVVKFPPLHPHCNCTVVEILDVDEQPEWAATVVQPVIESEEAVRA